MRDILGSMWSFPRQGGKQFKRIHRHELLAHGDRENRGGIIRGHLKSCAQLAQEDLAARGSIAALKEQYAIGRKSRRIPPDAM
jgi:hypothetical protein